MPLRPSDIPAAPMPASGPSADLAPGGHGVSALERLLPTAELDPLRGEREPHGPNELLGAVRRIAPGLALVGVAVSLAFAAHGLVPSLSPLVVAVVLGALAGNLGLVPGWSRAGAHFAAKRFLRLGVVLLGLQLAVGEVLALGGPALAVVAVTVFATFFGTRWLGRRLGLPPGLSLLVATGYSICGASAIAAVDGVSDADDDDVALAIGLVTLCGSLAMLALPLARAHVGLDDAGAFGSWVGASVHDVGQVVAGSATAGPAAVSAAVIVKLTRVVLLAPMVAGLSIARRRAEQRGGVATAGAAGPKSRRPPIVPLFVVGFLAAIVLRSTGAVPAGWLDPAKTLQDVLLAAALVGLGTGVTVAGLRRAGGRPLLLGAASWVLVAGVSLAGVWLTH